MPGLVPGIHVFLCFGSRDVDGRVKPGHDGSGGAAGFTPAPQNYAPRAFRRPCRMVSLLPSTTVTLPLPNFR
jgi:hypothetical protein